MRLIAGLSIAATVVVCLLPPIRQHSGYHSFADRRAFAGIPNFLDVISNLPFAVVGAIGLLRVARGGTWSRAMAAALFAGLGFTAAGSAYYHLAPDDARLFWDRAGIALVGAALLALVIADRLGESRLLGPLAAASVASVVYWRWSADLRFYGLAQFLPLALIPLLMARYPPRHTRNADLAAVVGLYVFARICELLDARIFALGGLVSGHTLKHLAAGLAAAWMLRVTAVKPAS